MYVRPLFREARVIHSTVGSTSGSVANSTLNSTTYHPYFSVTLVCSTGDIWINPTTTATTNDFKLNEGDSIDLIVKDTLSTIADTTTAKWQAIIWK
jgi:hypothetical protein